MTIAHFQPSWGSETRLRLLLVSTLLSAVAAAPGALPASATTSATNGSEDPSDQPLTGDEIAAAMDRRDEGRFKSQRVEMVLQNGRGKSRQQVAQIYRLTVDGMRKSVLFYESPSDVRGTGFLTYDYDDAAKEDDQWLYLPSLRKSRRISAADRGDWFMGTDLTYEEIKKDGKFALEDSNWKRLEDSAVDGHACFELEAVVRNPALAKELGHHSARIWVDQESFFPRRVEYRDEQGRRLRTVHTTRLELVAGIWTALEIEATRHGSGASTRFELMDIDYETQLEETLFSQAQLRRGRP